MDKEQTELIIHEGRTANVVLNWMDPIFQKVEKDLIDSLKINFRQGKYTELLLACHVAQLVALEDLKVRIKGLATAGESAQKTLEHESE